MASIPDDEAELLAQLTTEDAPAWDSPDDIGRISIEAFAAQSGLGRTQASQGHVRLFGEAVEGHSARLDEAGGLMIAIQRMVSAFGASLRNQKSQRGPLSRQILQLTRLRLSAAPAAGSLVLTLIPETDVVDELPDEPALPTLDAMPLVDGSLIGLVELLSAFVSSDSDDVEDRLNTLGPRVATSIRNFTREVSDDQLNVELVWNIPGRPAAQARIEASDAERITEFVSSRRLDTEPVELYGELRTISDRRKWDIELTDGGLVQVDPVHLAADVYERVSVGQTVVVDALMTVRTRPGGAETQEYVAVDVWTRGRSLH